MTSAVKPLAWPPNWRETIKRKRILLGIPVVGPQEKAFAHISKQLSERDPKCLVAWGSDCRRQQLAMSCSKILKSEFGWPNAHFLPTDPFEIICWDKSAYFIDELRIPAALSRIEALAQIPQQSQEWWTRAMSATLGEVIDQILLISGESSRSDAASSPRKN